MTGRRVLLPYVRRHGWALAGAAATTIVLTVATLAAPWPLKFVIDRLLAEPGRFELGGDDLVMLAATVVAILAIAAASALAQYASDVLLKRSAEEIVHDLRVALYDHLQRLSLAFHERQPTGNLVTRLTGDVASVGTLFSDSLGRIVSAVLLLGGMAAVTVLVDPLLAVAVLGIGPALFLVTWRYKRTLKQLAKRQRAEEGEIASLAGESLSAMQVVKAFGSERYEHERVERRSRERLAIGVVLSRTEARFGGLVDVLGAVATAVVVVVGVFRVAAGEITPGDLVVFTSYASRTYKPLRDIARQLGKVSQSLVRADRVAEILATDIELPEVKGAYARRRARGAIELRNVSFAYPGGHPVLRDVSLRIRPGEKVAIVGASGAGKSTLAALVARFYDPSAGSIAIDGRDVRSCALPWLRAQVGFLLQETVLFSGTVAANIAYASDAPPAAVVAAAKVGQAHDFITGLPAGYLTELGPRGVGLSGGQRQRLGIARVLLRKPSILVLDEPTTGLDAASERAVVEGLMGLMRGRTTLVITHSMDLARQVDRVLVFRDGTITEDGPPERVLAAEERKGAGGPSGPPPLDPALPQLHTLLDRTDMRTALERSLAGGEHPRRLGELEVARVRYQPRERVIVHYRASVDGRERHAVATALAGQDLEAKLRGPRFARVAGVVGPRSPAPVHDPAVGAILSWVPFDIRLPGLTIPPVELAERLEGKGISVPEPGSEPELLGYKPASRAVLRLGGLILKAYAKERQFEAAVTGLRTSGHAPALAAPAPSAELGDLRMTVQPVVPGEVPPDAAAVAERAGEYLRTLHAHDFEGLAAVGPDRQLEAAARHAELASAIVPDLTPTLRDLLRRLAATLPDGLPLPPSHGDFHVDQLLLDGDDLVVVDFDDMCRAPAALDVATYAADVVRGRGGDLAQIFTVLSPLCEGYGGTPASLDWYLSTAILCRATHPFRAQTPDWPDRVRGTVRATEEVFHR